MTNKYDIFISYSRKDAQIVNDVVSKLEAQGFKIWLDKKGIESGDAFKRIIVRAIEESTCVLFFSSANSNLSKWTAKEIGVAVYENKTIIPVLIDKSRYNPEIKFDLINLDYIDYTEPELYPEMLAKLINTLHSKCQKHNDDSLNQTKANNGEMKKSSARYDFLRKNIKSYFNNIDKRNPFVNFILFAIQIFAVLLLMLCMWGSLGDFSLLDSPEWSFSRIYGKGSIPGFLMSISVFVCNGLILKWNRNGFFWLVSSFILIFIPTIWNEFEEFIYFSVFSLLGVAVYFLVLLIRHNGISTWKLCEMKTNSIRNMCIGAISLWLMLLVAFPIIMGKATGFTKHLYKNGMIAIDARFNGNAFYIRRLANKIAFQNNENNTYSANRWYQKAIYEGEREYAENNDKDWRCLDCYIDYVYFLVKNNQEIDAVNYIKQACAKFGIETVKKEIEDDTYQYDRSPYREEVLRCLSYISNEYPAD